MTARLAFIAATATAAAGLLIYMDTRADYTRPPWSWLPTSGPWR